jgi:hypothetical protein
MKTIPLTQGKFAVVDDEDFEWLSALGKWCAWSPYKDKRTFYATRGRGKGGTMGRQILGAEPGEVDYKDRSGLNNTRANLRISSHAGNGQNRGKTIKNTSGWKGVTWDRARKRWKAMITANNQIFNLGRFDSALAAAKAYNSAAQALHGEFAWLNPI